MADLADAPAALLDFYEWLLTQGYAVREDVPGGPFNQFVVFEKASMQLMFRATNGDWDLGASLDEGRHFWRCDHLEAFLDRKPWIGEDSNFEHQVGFLRSRLAELVEAWRLDPSACAELNRIGDEWMSWRFGLPVPPGGFPRNPPC